MASPPISRRSVFFVGGYDPQTPEAFFRRLEQQLQLFCKLWAVETTVSDISRDSETGVVTLTSKAADGSWSTTTRVTFLGLDSLVFADFARPLPVRVARYLRTFADFVLTGTAFRMCRLAWRFGLYFLFPFVMILLFALAGTLAAWFLWPWTGWLSLIIGIAVYALLQATLGKRWPVNHLMDLWTFTLGYFRGQRPDANALMQHFARLVVEDVRSDPPDELILAGHSTGGLLILDIAARARRLDPGVFTTPGKAAILTLGSTALKAGLHPAGNSTRESVRELSEPGGPAWVEIQCLTDVINLYKTNPVSDMGLTLRPDFPIVRQIRVRDMLEAGTYKRIKWKPLRIHYQYVFGNTKRYWYDFFQIVCGPLPLAGRARDQISGDTRILRREAHDA